MQQMKQEKTLENKLNEIDTSNLPETEFKTMIIKLLNELRGRLDEHNENLNREIVSIKKDMETIKKNWKEMKNTITKMKNTLEGFNSILEETEGQISELEDKVAEYIQPEQQKEKRILKNEDSLRDLWDSIKRNNIRIIGVPKGEEREQGIENLFEEIMTENFPNLAK